MSQTKKAIILAMLLAGVGLFAQQVISARGGLIHYNQGEVSVNNQLLEPKFGNFPLLKDGDRIQTGPGRVEILLGPGAFLRMSESGDLRVVSSKLLNTDLELRSGSIIVEYVERAKNNVIIFRCKNMTANLLETGLYRLDAKLGQLQVYKGKVRIELGNKIVTAGKGKQATFSGGAISVEKFNTKVGDNFSRWSRQRAEYLAMANLSTAKSIYDNRLSWRTSGWLWNPYFGMLTFVPRRNCDSFYGYHYWSPGGVNVVYAPPQPNINASSPVYDSRLGYVTVPQTPAGTSRTLSSSAPPTAASSSQTAPIPREAKAGSRGR